MEADPDLTAARGRGVGAGSPRAARLQRTPCLSPPEAPALGWRHGSPSPCDNARGARMERDAESFPRAPVKDVTKPSAPCIMEELPQQVVPGWVHWYFAFMFHLHDAAPSLITALRGVSLLGESRGPGWAPGWQRVRTEPLPNTAPVPSACLRFGCWETPPRSRHDLQSVRLKSLLCASSPAWSLGLSEPPQQT